VRAEVRILGGPDQQRGVVEAPEAVEQGEGDAVVVGIELAGEKALGLGAAVAVGEVGSYVAVEQLVGERAAVVDGLGRGEGQAKQGPPRPRPHDGVADERDLRETHERPLVARRPIVVGLGVGDHEPAEAVRVLGGE
jgi:hypothetical protein